MMKEKKVRAGVGSLRWFLIKRFLFVMIFLSASEELLNIGYRFVVIPFLTNTMHIREISFARSEGNMLLFMLQMFLLSAASLLPESLSVWVQNLIGKTMSSSWQINIISPVLEGITDKRWIAFYQTGIFLLFLILFMISLLPYLLSILWYYREVSRKVKELLDEEKRQQEDFDKRRNLLLSDIAHDIKTPITTVCGYARALTDGVVEEEEKKEEYLQAIYAKSMRIDELITLLFEYVKLNSSGFTLHREPSDLGELLREDVALLYPDFEEKGIELLVDIPEQSFPFRMDKVQMSRAVNNVLTNAVKYNRRGTKVAVSLDMQYQIRIADTGEPIGDALAGHIFDPFSRGDAARRSTGGNGLGLSIASQIVRMHGGELILERQCPDGYAKAFRISFPEAVWRRNRENEGRGEAALPIS